MILILAETVYTKNFFFLYFLPPCILPPPLTLGYCPTAPFQSLTQAMNTQHKHSARQEGSR